MPPPEDRRHIREFTWRSMRESRRMRVIFAWTSTILLIFSAYRTEAESLGATGGKIWGTISLLLTTLCIGTWTLAHAVSERIRASANIDGLFILESLSPDGDSRQCNIDRGCRALMRSIATPLQSGTTVPDNIRSEAIRIAELGLGREADVRYDAADTPLLRTLSRSRDNRRAV